MLLFLGVYVFWIMLRGELGKYAAFATSANPAGMFGGQSLLQFLGWTPSAGAPQGTNTILTPGGLPQNDPYLPGYTPPAA